MDIDGVVVDLNTLLQWIAGKISEVSGKLPSGVVLSDEDISNIVMQAIGRFGPELLTQLTQDLVGALKAGNGPSEHDQSFLA